MNNKIKELAEQAEVWITEGEYDKCEVDMEVFAQLIVKECASHIMNSSDRHRREYFAKSVLEHFGVNDD